MRNLLTAILLTGLLAPLIGTAAAQDLLPSIQRIVDQGGLKIAIIEGTRPPLIKRDQEGRLSGFDVELGEEIARALGVEPRFVAAGPESEDVIAMVAAGEADIGLSYLSESVEAGRRVFFAEPYVIEAHTVFFNRVKGGEFVDNCPSVGDLRQMAQTEGTVGILELSAHWDPRATEDVGAGATRFADMESLVAAVESGDIVVSVQGELLAKYYLSRHPEAAIRVGLCTVPRVRHRVAAAVRPDAPDLLRWLDLYIKQRGVIIDLDTLLYRADRAVY